MAYEAINWYIGAGGYDYVGREDLASYAMAKCLNPHGGGKTIGAHHPQKTTPHAPHAVPANMLIVATQSSMQRTDHIHLCKWYAS
jgi:hypothetical protein